MVSSIPGVPLSEVAYSPCWFVFGQQSAFPALHFFTSRIDPIWSSALCPTREIFCAVFRYVKCVLSREVFCEVFRDWVFRRLLAFAKHRFLANGLLTNSSRLGSPSEGPPSMIFEERALAFV